MLTPKLAPRSSSAWPWAWAVAPTFAGAIMHGTSLMTPLLLGASMKIAYDLALWRAFRADLRRPGMTKGTHSRSMPR